MRRLYLIVAIALVFFGVAPSSHASAPDPAMSTLLKQAPGLRAEVLKLALTAAKEAEQKGLVTRDDLLTVIDYSLPLLQPRLFVFDLTSRKLLFRELVAHGRNSGGDVASQFSNEPGSLESSLGLFVTADTYEGHNGYSLRLRGLEKGINDLAWDRSIVMHGAQYVSREAIRALGRLGRSWGCPAVSMSVAHKIIDTIRGGSPVFAYYPAKRWLSASAFLH